jgi:hypothetical protein
MRPINKVQGAQAAEDVADAIINAAGDILVLHGNDPNQYAILAAGFSIAIARIDKKIDPTFKAYIMDLLLKT